METRSDMGQIADKRYMDPGPGVARTGLLDQLDQNLSRLFGVLDQLEEVIAPIRTHSPEAAMEQPQEAPANRLHEMVMRVDYAVNRVLRMRSELHL